MYTKLALYRGRAYIIYFRRPNSIKVDHRGKSITLERGGGRKCVEDARHAWIDLAIILLTSYLKEVPSHLLFSPRSCRWSSRLVRSKDDRSNTNRFDPIPFSLFFSSFLPSLRKREKKIDAYISFERNLRCSFVFKGV